MIAKGNMRSKGVLCTSIVGCAATVIELVLTRIVSTYVAIPLQRKGPMVPIPSINSNSKKEVSKTIVLFA